MLVLLIISQKKKLSCKTNNALIDKKTLDNKYWLQLIVPCYFLLLDHDEQWHANWSPTAEVNSD